jgi:hypothetical protein
MRKAVEEIFAVRCQEVAHDCAGQRWFQPGLLGRRYRRSSQRLNVPVVSIGGAGTFFIMALLLAISGCTEWLIMDQPNMA